MKPAAIAAQLVDLRNVGTHKVVKLTVHVPEEHALKLTEAFGWPTMVNPVPVAIARLVEPKEGNEEVSEEPRSRPHGGGEHKKWDELSPAQQAGIRCADGSFYTFLHERYTADWHHLNKLHGGMKALMAADMVRNLCQVPSRADFATVPAAAQKWRDLDSKFRAWQREPEVVG